MMGRVSRTRSVAHDINRGDSSFRLQHMENAMSINSDAPEQQGKAGLGRSHLPSAPPRLDAVSWMIILVLLSLMVATDFVAYLGWTLASRFEVSTAAYVAMAAGVLLSLVIGGGLMTLVFYSSRSGYDEPPVFKRPDTDSKRAVRRPADDVGLTAR